MLRNLALMIVVLGCLLAPAACATVELDEQEPVAEEEATGQEAVEGEAAETEEEEAPADAEAGPAVLVVQSYHEGFEWSDAQDTAIREALAGSGAEVTSFYMDTKRQTSEEAKLAAGAGAVAKLEEVEPELVIAVDDNAQEYFAKAYAGVEGAPQIVFSGVNADPALYGYPAANVTGIAEETRFAESLELLLEIAPDVERVVVLSDVSPTSDQMIERAMAAELPVEIVAYEQPATFDEWQAAVTAHQEDADAIAVFLYHTVKATPDATESMEPREIIGWMLTNNALPTVGILDISVLDGLMCGVVESGWEQGRAAGEIAARILAGEAAADIPITGVEEGACMISAAAAGALGIMVPEELFADCNVLDF